MIKKSSQADSDRTFGFFLTPAPKMANQTYEETTKSMGLSIPEKKRLIKKNIKNFKS